MRSRREDLSRRAPDNYFEVAARCIELVAAVNRAITEGWIFLSLLFGNSIGHSGVLLGLLVDHSTR